MNKIDIFQTQDFVSLPQEKKTEVLTNYFNKNIADDSFKSLEAEKQNNILNNFINSQISLDNVQGKEAVQNIEAPAAPVPQNIEDIKNGDGRNGFWEKAKQKFDGAIGEINTFFKTGLDGIETGINTLNPIASYTGDLDIVDDSEGKKNYDKGKVDNSIIQDLEALSKIDIGLINNDPEKKEKFYDTMGNILNKRGYDLGQKKDGNLVAIDKEGNELAIKNDFWESFLDGIKSDIGEIGGAVGGLYAGTQLAKNVPNPYLKAGVVAGSSLLGAVGGNALDMTINNLKDREKLDWDEIGNELSKSAVLDLAGNAVAAGVAKVGGKVIDTIKSFNLSDEIEKQVIDSFAKIPQEAREDTLKALQFAEDNGIKLTPTDIVNHANLDQFVQVLARNSFIRNAIKDSEMKNQQLLKDNLFKKIDEIGDKASAEEIGAVVQQELKEAQSLRETDVRKAYEDFKQGVSGDYIVPTETIKDKIYREALERDGIKSKDELKDIKNSLIYPLKDKELQKDIDNIFERLKLRASYSEISSSQLNAKELHEVRKYLSNMENSLYDTNRQRSAIYGIAKKTADDYIDALASFEKDEVSQLLVKAKKSNIEKANIYGISSKHKDIKNALDSAEPNKMIETLLTGTNALDNANILNIELSKTKHGKSLLGALGRKYLDDAFSSLDKLTASSANDILKNDKIEVSKRLLGKEAAEHIEQTQKLFSMMINTENLLKGTGAEIATQRTTPITTRAFDFITKTITRFAQYKVLGKFMLSDEPQKVLKSVLEKATKIKTEDDVSKFIDRNLRQLDYVARKKLNIDTSDIIDLKKAREDLRAKKQTEAEKQAKKEAEEQQEKELLLKEVENFQTPDIYESRVISRFADDNKFASFAQLVTRIQKGTATQPDIEQYIKLKNSINPDILEKNILKEKYPENAFSIHKLNDLKSFANEKVNEIISEDEFKALIYNLDKHNKLPNTTQEIENKYREKFYQLHKLYEEEKALKEIEKQTVEDTEKKAFEEAEKAGLIPFAKFGDNLLAGTVAGVETDEDGNIVGFDPEMFVVGLGGYTALKTALKNKEIQGALKDYALKIVEYVDMNPAIYKQNGLNAMFVGAKPNEQGAFSDVATKKVMREIDDSKAILNTRNIDNVKNNLGINEVSPISGIEYTKNADGTYEVLLMNKNAKNTNQIPKLTLKDNELKTYFNDEQIAKIRNDYGDDYSDLYDDGKLHKYFKTDGIFNPNSGGKLSDYIQHDELFKKYPELKDLDTAFSNDVKGAYLGSAEHPDGSIKPIMVIGRSNIEGDKSLLLHEIQHAIQNKEGWARGGNPEEFTNNLSDNFLKEYSNKYSVAEKKVNELSQKIFDARFNDIPDSELSKLKQDYEIAKRELTAIEDSKVLEQSKTKHEKYQSLWGEQQARATQQRMNYTPEQRASEDWTKTLANNEGKYNEPIIKYDNGVAMSQSAKDYKDNQGFYSVLEKTIDEKVGGKIDSVSLAKVLEKNGVKQDELEWSGLKDLLDSKDKLTKEEIQNTINENRLVLEKVEKEDYLGKASKLTKQLEDISKQPQTKENTKEFNKILKERDDLERKHISTDTSTHYSNYILDGGENYREILFRMPHKLEKGMLKIYGIEKDIPSVYKKEMNNYKSDHWKESNIIVFTRVDDRTIDNKKTLFIEELQSDWHQDGRKKGYGDKKSQVPNAPFKKNWHELGLKRMIQEAVENDYEKIAWTTGKQQASRYSLEKEIDTVVYNKESGYLQASKNGDEVIFKKVASDEEVANLLGKEITNRLIDPKQSTRENIFVLQGEDVKFGGDGMKAFYDEIVPNTAKKLFKKYNVKPKLEELDDLEEMVWSVEITPKMKEDIKKYGQPLYAIGGALAIGNELSNNGDNNE